jgi:outer membrane protein OmpA-like peptidoglycan-associated protein
LVQLLRQSRAAMSSIKQDADAIKALPVVRSYVTDARKELFRPECECNRRWFRTQELFEPERAVLTTQGREKLDSIVPWLEGLKHKGSEVVVATYADPAAEAEPARELTQKQSEAVCDYLTQHHKVQKMGVFSWSRKVAPIGLGTEPPPGRDREKLPAPRVEVLVFIPQK